MTPHLNCLDETVQMRGHNISFYAELTKIIPNYHKYSLLSRALYNRSGYAPALNLSVLLQFNESLRCLSRSQKLVLTEMQL